MMLPFALLLASAVAIYLACEFFVNGVEWVGRKFKVSQNATGSVLAAFGTALPESVVTFVAVVFGAGPEQKELGVGAAIGGPLALATVAYAVVGLTFILTKGKLDRHLFSRTSTQRLISDQKWFMSIFVVKITLGLVAFAIKPWLGILFLVAYGLYVRKKMQSVDEAGDEHEELESLKICPSSNNPSTGWALLQCAGALVVIFFSSQLFVHQLETIGPWLGLPAQIVALLLSPIATELPEILNAVIWVRQGKQNMALSNISGAMMIQATIPSALGIFFTPWILGHVLVWAAIVTMASILGLYFLLKHNKLTGSRLSWFGMLYVIFAAGLYFIPF
ncbi:MAG: sodium:calcium antiporter [Glaciimonas sp.]|nr:sodium:calcium antiporter [Glaciimonas sp.]